MITHSYAMLSRYLKREDDAKKYLMMSAIADIQNATRETASLQALALIQYEENNLADAFKFTQSAIDDVVSSGIHFRAMEIYKFYSIINTAYQTEEARSKSNLITFSYLNQRFSFSFNRVGRVYLYSDEKNVADETGAGTK